MNFEDRICRPFLTPYVCKDSQILNIIKKSTNDAYDTQSKNNQKRSDNSWHNPINFAAVGLEQVI